MPSLARAVLAEFVGTAFLLAAVVGSGIMGEKLSGGNTGVALLANSLATGGALIALIGALGPISGAHFNPAVTLFSRVRGEGSWSRAASYAIAQFAGSIAGVLLAHLMFDLAPIQASAHVRATWGELLGEVVATFGLLLTIWGVSRAKVIAVPFAVAAYIIAAYWFTSSTSFANPAVTVARSLTDTFAGIAPSSVFGFLIAQCIGVALALGAVLALSDNDR